MISGTLASLSSVLNGSLILDRKEVLGNFQIKGCETDEEKAKHAAAKRWVYAVSNWGNLGRWFFHVCRDTQLLGKELEYI